MSRSTRTMRYDYLALLPEGSAAHDQQSCSIVARLGSDEDGVSRYRIRFADGTVAEALEPELTIRAPR